MARILMIGYGPLPRPGVQRITSSIHRTCQLLQGILEDDHTVNLFTLPVAGNEEKESQSAAMLPDQYEGFHYQRFTTHSGEMAIDALNAQVRQLEPDAILGVNTYPSYLGATLGTTLPLWCDLNGLWMAEMQALCRGERSDSRLAGAWSIEKAILRRLDKFSAVSRPQLHAVLGEMASIGRLNQHTFNYHFGCHIPNAGSSYDALKNESAEPILRGPIVPNEAFIILWCGSFNLWADIETLFEAMNDLMGRYPEVHFASVGGKQDGLDTRIYENYEDAIEASPYKERFHKLGWVRPEELTQIYREADLGINIDGPNYETLFGARSRINAMASEGLAIVTTLGTEISEWLEDGKAALTAKMSDPRSLVDAIEPWIEQREQLLEMAQRARKIMETDFSHAGTTRPLRSWLKSPKLAPDNEAKLLQSGDELMDLNSVSINSLEELAVLLERFDPSEVSSMIRDLEDPDQRSSGRLIDRLRRWMTR